jgi:transcription elongation factor Elf1
MAQIIEPSITKKSFNCPHCGALAHQSWHDVNIKEIDNKQYLRQIAKIGKTGCKQKIN